MNRVSTKLKMPERPYEGMNFHDWATYASVALLSMLFVVGLISVITTNTRLEQIEKNSSKGIYQDTVDMSLTKSPNLSESEGNGTASSIEDLKIQLKSIEQDLKVIQETLSKNYKVTETSSVQLDLSDKTQPVAIPNQSPQPQISVDEPKRLGTIDQ